MREAYTCMCAVYMCMCAVYMCMRATYMCVREAYMCMHAVYMCMCAVYMCMCAVYMCMCAVYMCMREAYMCMCAVYMCMYRSVFHWLPAHFRSVVVSAVASKSWNHSIVPPTYVASITAEDLNDFTALHREHCEVKSRISTCVAVMWLASDKQCRVLFLLL